MRKWHIWIPGVVFWERQDSGWDPVQLSGQFLSTVPIFFFFLHCVFPQASLDLVTGRRVHSLLVHVKVVD